MAGILNLIAILAREIAAMSPHDKAAAMAVRLDQVLATSLPRTTDPRDADGYLRRLLAACRDVLRECGGTRQT